MGTGHLFVGGDVDTVDFVSRHIAVQPLDLRPEAIQNTTRFLRESEHLVGRYISDVGKFALNDVFWACAASFQRFRITSKKEDAQREPASPAALFM